LIQSETIIPDRSKKNDLENSFSSIRMIDGLKDMIPLLFHFNFTKENWVSRIVDFSLINELTSGNSRQRET